MKVHIHLPRGLIPADYVHIIRETLREAERLRAARKREEPPK
jgi:hypothetical protein